MGGALHLAGHAVYVASTMDRPDVVARIYDHALAGNPTALLGEVAAAAEVDALGFAFHDDVMAGRALVAFGVEPRLTASYPRHFREDAVWAAAMCAASIGAIQEALPRPLLERTRFYDEWLRPQGWAHVLKVRLWGEPGCHGGLVVGRLRAPNPRRRSPMTALQRLVPHVRRAIEAWRRLDQVRGLAALSADVVDLLPIAIVLVDPHTAVISMNRAAEELVDAGRGTRWDGGMLRFTSADATAQLRDACARRTTASFVVSRHRGAPLEVLVSPLPGDADAPMAVVLGDRERTFTISADLLRVVYGLTPAQAHLASVLAQGFSLQEAATRFGVAVGTMRDRVKQVFARTGTRSQADLVRLVLTGPGLLQRGTTGSPGGAAFAPLRLADVLGGGLVRRRDPSFEG
ncbi:MAG TPA: hypothetical protein VGR62_20285 [Candidatus Binatia bacterium]|jgi:PAS domain-containing protein/DNA-binding CsgD family transcriptional regulator|nr:hypothetical protein [Candidatus Binatia bacterium]